MSAGAVAVTGAAGFLGRRLCQRLAAAGRPVVALAREPERVAPGRGIEPVRWAIGEPLPGRELAAVVHAAAYRPPRYGDPSEAGRCLALNAEGTALLAESAIASGAAELVYVSAGNVYAPLDRPAREDDPIAPSWRAPYYLGSKICGEWFATAAGTSGRIRTTAVRPSAIYGPGMPPGLVSTFAARLRAGESVTVADGGRYRADLVYVDDVAEGIAAALDRGASGVYNLGAGEATTSLALARTLAALLGASEDAIVVEPPRGDPPGFVALDIARARRDLAYAPRSLEAGLRAMLAGASP